MTTSRQTPRARALRRTGGLAERKVWARLRDGAVDGLKVRRQHPISPYVVDFACERLKLFIELDGAVHDLDERVVEDHIRQQAIEAAGWTVVRFSNAVALTEPWRIDEALRERAKVLGMDPSPDGRGLEPPGA